MAVIIASPIPKRKAIRCIGVFILSLDGGPDFRWQYTFSFEDIKFREAGGNILQLYVVKQNVDLTQAANWDTEFRWLRENLEKLYWVLRVHDTLGWSGAASTENS